MKAAVKVLGLNPDLEAWLGVLRTGGLRYPGAAARRREVLQLSSALPRCCLVSSRLLLLF